MKCNAPYHQRERGGHAISLIPNSGTLFPVKFKKPDLFAMLTFIRSTQNSAIAHLQSLRHRRESPRPAGPSALRTNSSTILAFESVSRSRGFLHGFANEMGYVPLNFPNTVTEFDWITIGRHSGGVTRKFDPQPGCSEVIHRTIENRSRRTYPHFPLIKKTPASNCLDPKMYCYSISGNDFMVGLYRITSAEPLLLLLWSPSSKTLAGPNATFTTSIFLN